VSSCPGVRVAGPLAAFAPGFVEDLVASGYRPGTAADQLRLMADVSRWLAEHELGAGDLAVSVVERFATERRAAGRARYLSSRALGPLLGYLRELGVTPLAVPAAPSTPAEVLIGRYSLYLLERRGLALSTVRNYVGVARVFLADRERVRGGLALPELDGTAVSEFVLRESRRCSVGSAKCMVTRLRALLRFLHVDGEVEQDLAGAVPSVASWRLASLVKALDARSVQRLLASCDRRTRVGRRDFVIVTLLSRLGCASASSPRSSCRTWIGAPVSCSCVARAVARSGCRCPLTSAKHSRAGSSGGGRAATRCSCSRACAHRMAGCRRVLSRRSCAAPASGRGCRWLARTVCGTRPRPRCSGPEGA
jgi:hypothetical protein